MIYEEGESRLGLLKNLKSESKDLDVTLDVGIKKDLGWINNF